MAKQSYIFHGNEFGEKIVQLEVVKLLATCKLCPFNFQSNIYAFQTMINNTVQCSAHSKNKFRLLFEWSRISKTTRQKVAISMIWIMGCHVSVASKTHYAYEKGVLPHPVSVQNTLFICAEFVAIFHVMASDIHYVHYFYSSTLSFSQFCYSNDVSSSCILSFFFLVFFIHFDILCIWFSLVWIFHFFLWFCFVFFSLFFLLCELSIFIVSRMMLKCNARR